MVNFDTDRIVIVYYKAGSGGKTVANLLGLSNNVVLQDHKIAAQQLNGELGTTDKLKLLLTRIQANSVEWDDLRMGCTQLFNMPSDVYLKDFPQLKEYWFFDPVIDRLSNSNQYFTLMCNSVSVLKPMLECWPNAQLIRFDNPRQLIAELRPSWGNPNANIEYETKYDALEIEQLEMLAKNLKFVYNWDSKYLLDTDATAANAEKLYTALGLTDYKDIAVRAFHKAWLSKVKELRDNEQ